MFREASIIVLLLHLCYRQSKASHAALDEAKATGLCKVAAELLKAPGLALQKYSDLQARAAAAADAALLATVASDVEQSINISTVFRAIALTAEKCALDAVEELNLLAQKATKATANAAKASGHISELLEMLRQGSYNSVARTKWCLGSTNAPTTAKAITELSCPAEYIEAIQPTAKLDETIISDTGYAGLSPGSAKLSGTGATSCGLLISAANGATNLWMTSNQAPINTIAGFMTLTAKDAAGSEDYTVSSIKAGAIAGAFANPTTTPQKIYNDIKQLEEHTVSGCGADVETVLKHAVSANSAATLLEDVLKTQEPYKTPKSAAQAAKGMIKQAADSSDSDQANKIVRKIKIQTAERIQQGKTMDKKLSDTSTAADNMRTLLLNHLKRREKIGKLASDLETADDVAAKAPHVSKPDDCKAKNVGACKDGFKEITENGEKKCVMDPDYKPIQEAGANQDDKTNTTGSNSFVVNKAPFLLAFLILA
uniref:Variant surface glycoprotein 1125.4342 n=1 Tax=Trypanosoma brucei TaxID=5691 RepID=A0A1J0RAS4_9TRYP|nr:variant surface glycoprotein 1125.4342 [Trypanosoma brucei]